jgi:hypothetical protein
MRVIIAGSRPPKNIRFRNGTAYKQWCAQNQIHVHNAVQGSKFPQITEVVSGAAVGFDDLGENYAHANDIPIRQFKPQYEILGQYLAPKARNNTMAQYADALIAIWDGYSGGTRHMISAMRELNKPVHIYRISTLPSQSRNLVGKSWADRGVNHQH